VIELGGEFEGVIVMELEPVGEIVGVELRVAVGVPVAVAVAVMDSVGVFEGDIDRVDVKVVTGESDRLVVAVTVAVVEAEGGTVAVVV